MASTCSGKAGAGAVLPSGGCRLLSGSYLQGLRIGRRYIHAPTRIHSTIGSDVLLRMSKRFIDIFVEVHGRK